MKVLLVDFDLFRAVGGGQTFYRGTILRNPRIDFYYFRKLEPEGVARPPNAHPIDLEEPYCWDAGDTGDLTPPRWTFTAFATATNIAHSAAGRSFDVVDAPDYWQYSAFLAPALARHGVDFGRQVLSMHGCVSTTRAFQWYSLGTAELSCRQLEVMQYAAVDTRYCISETYRDDWRAVSDLETYCIDPMWFFSFPERKPYVERPGPPDLNFIGRTEKCKGAHLFLQLAWWLPRALYRNAAVVGPDAIFENGDTTSNLLRAMDKMRRNDVQFHRCMTPSELSALFASKSITVLPSLYDTLNLAALESLFSGCPAMISSGAGVCRYLRARFPELPFETFDLKNQYANVPRLEEMLRQYSRHRTHLEAQLAKIDFQPQGMSLEETYRTPPSFDLAARVQLEQWYEQMYNHCAREVRNIQVPQLPLRMAG